MNYLIRFIKIMKKSKLHEFQIVLTNYNLNSLRYNIMNHDIRGEQIDK